MHHLNLFGRYTRLPPCAVRPPVAVLLQIQDVRRRENRAWVLGEDRQAEKLGQDLTHRRICQSIFPKLFLFPTPFPHTTPGLSRVPEFYPWGRGFRPRRLKLFL